MKRNKGGKREENAMRAGTSYRGVRRASKRMLDPTPERQDELSHVDAVPVGNPASARALRQGASEPR